MGYIESICREEGAKEREIGVWDVPWKYGGGLGQCILKLAK